MRAHLGDRRSELTALAAPAEFRIGKIALIAERRAEMFADLRHAIELVFRNVLGGPVAAVVGEVELLVGRIPVEADRIPYALRDYFHAAAVEIDSTDLGVRVGRHAVVTRLTDRDVELVVGTDADELPAMRFILRQVVVDHRKFGRVVEVVLDLLRLRDLRQLGDVERAVLEREAVRSIETRVEHLDLALAVLLDDGMHLVDQAAADEHSALVAFAH